MLDALLACAAALLATPQDPRTPVELGVGAANVNGVSVASDDELSLAFWSEEFSTRLMLAASDGRGVHWSAPVVVAQDDPGGFVGQAGLVAFEGSGYVFFRDHRFDDDSVPSFVASGLVLRVFDPVGGALGADVPIPTGSPPERTNAGFHALAIHRVGDEVRLHVAMWITVAELDGSFTSRLILVTSRDGGQSFEPPLTITPVPGSVDLDLEVDGDVVNVLWIGGSLWQESVFHQRSIDGGLTLEFPMEHALAGGEFLNDLVADQVGQTLAVAWLRSSKLDPTQRLWSLVSSDGGASFGPTASHSPSFEVGESDPIALARPTPGEALLAWSGCKAEDVDPLFGCQDELLLRHTADGGATWGPITSLSNGPGRFPSLVASDAPRNRVVAHWIENSTFGVAPLAAAVSLDGGVSWGAPVSLSTANDVRSQRAAYNDRYQNVVTGWATGTALETTGLFVGGFRPQFLTPTGFAPGPATVGAEFSGFDDGSSLAWMLLSTSPGSLLLPDGRGLGLARSPLLLDSLVFAGAGLFATPLDSTGGGALLPLAGTLPAGTSLYAVGLAFEPSTFTFGDASDVVRIDL